ncbi:uncharacterized protein LOC125376807 [Haliotis rufescens]|uniref:uncharacterized protein LOC125376807 n=1 Tax=Haliotis rufescens TaxID=6454 RepID=UPI00201F1CEE|nr:uncharacterized protein LOC125376807 [Haliotis rufescens]
MTSMMLWSLLLALTVTTVSSLSDLVSYDINTQAICTEVTRARTLKCVWPAGLNPFADQIAEGGRIIAYKIQWFNGAWSGWYVPGYNDIDSKFNPSARRCAELPYRANTMRRMWSYFYDHTHRFIICKAQ